MLLLDVAKGRLEKITILLLAFVNTGFTLNYIYAYMRSEDIDDEACATAAVGRQVDQGNHVVHL